MCKKSLLMMLLLAIIAPWAANAQTSLFSEDFEGGSMPAGWTTDGSGSWSVGVGDYSTTTGAGQGSYNALIMHGTTGNVTKLITPEIDLSSVTSATLSFMHVQRSWSGDIDYLKVYYRTSSSETWTQLVAYTSAISSWTTEEEIVLPNTTATYQLAFEHTDNYGYGVGLDQVVIIAPSSCPKPTGLNFALTPGDGTVATLSWTSDADAWQICLNGDETNLIAATTNPYTLTGLTPETTYTAKVRANCGSEQSDWSNEVTFTPTNAYSITVNDGTDTHSYVPFYGYYADSDANSQFIIPADGLSAMTWGTIEKLTFYTSTGTAAWNGAVFDIYFSEVDYSAFETAALIDWSELSVKVYTGTVSVANNKMELTLTTPYNYMGGNLLIGFDETSNSSNYPSAPWYGVTQTNNTAVYKYSSYNAVLAKFLPKVTFGYTPGEEPSCFKPTGLAVNYTGGTEATISWTSAAEAWQICVNDDEENLIDVTETTYNFTGLAPETTYTVKVRTNCGDEYSDWTNNVSFTTTEACPAPTGFAASNITAHTADLAWTGFSESYTVQYRSAAYMDGIEEGFGTSSLPTGWTRYTGLVDNVMAGTATLESTTSGWSFDTNNGVFDNHARTNIYGASWDKWLVTPSIEVSGHLSFDLALTAYGGTLAAPQTSGTDDRFIVLVSTDEKATWTILREWNNSGSDYVYNDITCSATGESVTIDLSSYMGQTVYIAFYGESTASNADNNLHIDNVTCGTPVPAGEMQYATNITEETVTLQGLLAETEYEAWLQGDCGSEGPSTEVGPITFTTDIACPAPTGLAVSNITGHEATINWTSAAEAWQICVNDDEENLIDVAEKTYTLTGLTPETAYTVKVRANCGDEGYSDWTDNVSFTTDIACPTPTNLTTSNITANSAVIAWTGNDDAASYNLRYATGFISDFFEDFENGLGQWTVVRSGEGDGNTDWHVVNSNTVFDNEAIPAHSGNYVVMSRSYNGSAYNVDNWLISPQVNIGSTMTYWVRDGGQYHEHYDIYVSTTITDISAFTKVYEPGDASAEWTEVTVDLSAYDGQTGYVAFRLTDYDKDFIFIDDITITFPSTVTVDWTTVNDVTSPYTIEGLTLETKYTAAVQAVYADGISAWASTTFTTLALDAIPLNLQADVMATTATLTWDGAQDSYNVRYRSVYYYNSFNTDEDRAGWSYSSAIYGVDDTVYDIPASSNYFLAMGWSTTAEDFIYSPALPAYPSGSTLEFYHFYLNEANTFQVGYSTTTNDATAFTWSNPIAATVSYQNGAYTVKYSQVLPDGVKYVAFKATAASQAASIFIDNFKIYKGAANNEWEETVSNVNARTLAITGLTPETEYEWQVQGNMTNGTTEWSERAFFTTMDVIIWNNPEDWPNDSVPEAYADVTIPANTQVIVPSGYTAYADEITIEEGGQITIEDGGQLYHSNEVPVTMQLAYDPNYTSSKDGETVYGEYRLIAAPVNPGVPVSSTGLVPESTDPNYDYVDLYYFDQNVGELVWINYKYEANHFDSLFIKKGYLYSNAQNILGIFAGNTLPTSVDVKEPLEYNPDVLWAGWNLVGNPFTCMAFVNRPYYKINGDGDAIAQAEGNTLEVFEGVFVLAEQADDTVTFFTFGATGSDPGGPEEFKMLTLNLNDGRSLIDRAIVRFDEGRQLLKLQMGSSTKVYIPKDGSDYAIVSSDDTGEMPVSFKAENDGTYTMNFSSENVNFSYLHLIDNKTGDDIDLLETPSYTFTARTNDYTNRFKLVFALGTTGIEESFAFFNNGNLVISNEGNATLQVVDVMGRILKNENINGSASVKVDAAPGVYMIRLTNGSNVKVQKVVVE